MNTAVHQISRRAFLPLIASAVLSPAAVIPAHAQAERWKLYRRDDAGFEIEMPGEPSIWPDVANPSIGSTSWIRAIEAHLEYEKVLFGIRYFEYRTVPPMDFLFRVLSMHARRAGRTVTGETPLLSYGVPAAEFVSESERSMAIERVFIPKHGTFNVSVHGDKDVGKNPLVRRFFDSFKLLPAK